MKDYLFVEIDIPDDHLFAAQHTWSPGCDGLHIPGPCPERQPVDVKVIPAS